MSEPKWSRVCILCADRGRKTQLQSGHICTDCAGWLMRSVAEILRLCDDAAAYVQPGASAGGGSGGSFGSKPPLCVEALDPELALLELNHGDPSSAVTILECLEMWERAVRQDRGMAPYGPASAHRANRMSGAAVGTNVTLTGCVSFLGSQVGWMVDAAEFDIQGFADHIRRSVVILGRWDSQRRARGTEVMCPTVTLNDQLEPTDDDYATECGYRLILWDSSEAVTCRRCHVTRTPSQLMAVVMTDTDRAVWVDPEAAAQHYGISERELRRWASKGHVKRSHGRYLLSDITKAVSA